MVSTHAAGHALARGSSARGHCRQLRSRITHAQRHQSPLWRLNARVDVRARTPPSGMPTFGERAFDFHGFLLAHDLELYFLTRLIGAQDARGMRTVFRRAAIDAQND